MVFFGTIFFLSMIFFFEIFFLNKKYVFASIFITTKLTLVIWFNMSMFFMYRYLFIIFFTLFLISIIKLIFKVKFGELNKI